MQPTIKIAVAIVAVALIVVIGLIFATQKQAGDTIEPAVVATEAPGETPEPADDDGQQDAQQAPDEEAQDTMYEGALAGLSEEEIARLAIAEEQAGRSGENSEPEPTRDPANSKD